MSKLLTIDFEASCLPKHGRSFPIEVALADFAGWSRSWLIQPHGAWTNWTWTAEAEALHGISFETLMREGIPAAQVAAELTEAAARCRILADSQLDTIWFETLCAAAGMSPAVRIGHIRELADALRSLPDEMRAAIAHADRAVPGRHRAGTDAMWLAALAGSLIEAAERRANDRPLFAWSEPMRCACDRTSPSHVAL